MIAQIIDIATGKRLPDIVEMTPEQIVSARIRQALRHWPPSVVGEAITEGYRRLRWNRTAQDAADAAITWANRRMLNLPPDDPQAA